MAAALVEKLLFLPSRQPGTFLENICFDKNPMARFGTDPVLKNQSIPPNTVKPSHISVSKVSSI